MGRKRGTGREVDGEGIQGERQRNEETEPRVSQYMVCDGFNENGIHRLIYLNICFPVGRLFGKDSKLWPCWSRCVNFEI